MNNEKVEVFRDSDVHAGGRFGRLCPVSTVSEANENMLAMRCAIPGMFSLSADEISARLTEKKTDLSLSDAQVKQVADLIASSEQQKIEDKMQGMRSATCFT